VFNKEGRLKMKSKTVLLFLILLLCLAGCKKAETAEYQKADVREEKDKVVIQTEQGKMEVSSDAGKDLELPEGFPSEKLPIYPNGSIVVSEDINGVYNIGIATNDDIKLVYEYYKKNLKVQSVTSEMLSGESANLIIQDDEKIGSVMVMLNNLPYNFKYIIFITYGG